MTTTPNHKALSLERAEDILAYIPHALGFHPEQSVVLLLMVDQRLEATLRVDLPSISRDAEERRWVDQVCELLDRLAGLTAILCVVYPIRSPLHTAQLPWNSLVQQLAAASGQRSTPLRHAWCQQDGQVGQYLSCDGDAGWLELSPTELNETYLRMVLAGSAPLSQPWDGSGVPEWPEAQQIRSLEHALDGDFLDSLDCWAQILDADPHQAEQRLRKDQWVPARLLHGLDTRAVRDVLPYLAGVGPAPAADAVRDMGRKAKGEGLKDLAEFLMGRGSRYPRWNRIEHFWFICRDLLGVAQGEQRAALLCLMAWVEWAKGRGSMSMALLRAALAGEPDYRLAQLLEQLLLRGIMPEWATDPQRAWRAKFG